MKFSNLNHNVCPTCGKAELAEVKDNKDELMCPSCNFRISKVKKAQIIKRMKNVRAAQKEKQNA